MSVAPSHRKDKKLVAVFSDGGATKTVHFGARSYGDYTLWYQVDPALARSKRDQYIRRHSVNEDWTSPTSAGTLARYILWERPTVGAAVAAFRRRFGV